MTKVNTIQCVRCNHSFSISKKGRGHVICPKCNRYTPYNFNLPEPYNDENDYQLEDRDKIWRNKNGQLHRDNDKPAVISDNGTQYWYKEGQLHRDHDKPAVIYANGTQEWYKEGKCHRENDLPSVIYLDGKREEYWINGIKIK